MWKKKQGRKGRDENEWEKEWSIRIEEKIASLKI